VAGLVEIGRASPKAPQGLHGRGITARGNRKWASRLCASAPGARNGGRARGLSVFRAAVLTKLREIVETGGALRRLSPKGGGPALIAVAASGSSHTGSPCWFSPRTGDGLFVESPSRLKIVSIETPSERGEFLTNS